MRQEFGYNHVDLMFIRVLALFSTSVARSLGVMSLGVMVYSTRRCLYFWHRHHPVVLSNHLLRICEQC
jgi:hypothetical protein